MNANIPADVVAFAETVEGYAKRAFPKGTFAWEGLSMGSQQQPWSLYFRLTTQGKQDWAYGIRENDPSYTTLWIHDAFTPDGGLLPMLKVTLSQGGKVYGHNFSNGVKVGWRDRTGTPDQILRHLSAYIEKLRMVYEGHVGIQNREAAVGLRAAVIKLAKENPSLRADLVPLLRKEDSYL